MENKETSIQWLMSQAVNWARNTNSGNDIVEFPKGAINQAKAMHKEEIITTWHKGYDNLSPMIDEDNCGDKYYNETYGGNK